MAKWPLYSARNLAKSYPMGDLTVRALRGVNLDIYEGELLTLLGPSGSGKSSLLNIIGGMDTPTEGQMLLKGTDISGFGERELTQYRRHHVGFIFQFFNLVPTLTAAENVDLAAQICDDPMDVMDVLEVVGLAARADHYPSQLSGGEQQRVAIARAVVKNPQVILGDEPTGALDYETGKLVLNLLKRIHKYSGRTVVIVTHNAAIGDMSDRVVRLRSGTVQDMRTNANPVDPRELSW